MTPSPKAKTKTQAEPWTFLDIVALVCFLVWSAAGLYFTANHITVAEIAKWQLPEGLRNFITDCRNNGDPILIILAFINTHLHAARQWSAGTARRWGAIVIAFAYAIECLGTKTGIPFGDYTYKGGFGPMIWGVPLCIPLAWHVVVTNAMFLVRSIAPHNSQTTEAFIVGMICTAYDFILEPFATTVKHYWEWTGGGGGVPATNYISWFILSGLLVRILSPTLSNRYRWDPRPLLILVLTVAIFIAGEMK